MSALLAESSSTVVTALNSAFGTIATDCQTAIAGALPVALPIMGAIVVVSVGIRIFKKVTGR